MGVGAVNVFERLSASIGDLRAVNSQFQPALDVPYGGVLFALPALLVTGLLSKVDEHFRLPKGYYGLESIFLLLGFMALARIKTIEDLRYCAPGEWGKLLGLDRIPEVRTLREKVKHLAQKGQGEKWSAEVCAQWMQSDTQAANVLYIDGHVRVYHGSLTPLPRHYVAREKLCLRATVDYWVNARGGQPFFYINKDVDPGLLSVLEEEIIPRLQKEVPGQPDSTQLKDKPFSHRFTLIYDREGYSPDFMKRMKAERIACITYHKHAKESWPLEEFTSCKLTTIGGNVVNAQLAERGTRLSNNLWVREIRKLGNGNKDHQTSILSTDYASDLKVVASEIADRWSQENFFKYMRQHYNLDRLVDYSLEDVSETTKVVNPDYRRLDGEVRCLNAQHSRRLAEFGSIHLEGPIKPEVVEAYQSKKAKLQEEVTRLEKELNTTKAKRKGVDRHILVSQLPEQERFSRLATGSKHLLDTIKMIAYRAETAMVNVMREAMAREDDGRALLRALYQTEVDLMPDEENKTLTVKLHHLTNHCSDKTIQHLCDELNETDTVFPGTNLRLIYKLGTS
jgi:prepilin-type processing-associated H-X9-DG protein